MALLKHLLDANLVIAQSDELAIRSRQDDWARTAPRETARDWGITAPPRAWGSMPEADSRVGKARASITSVLRLLWLEIAYHRGGRPVKRNRGV